MRTDEPGLPGDAYFFHSYRNCHKGTKTLRKFLRDLKSLKPGLIIDCGYVLYVVRCVIVTFKLLI